MARLRGVDQVAPLGLSMNQTTAHRDATETTWDTPPRSLAPDDEKPLLVVDLDGFAGPLDLLLALARTQKVDLSAISIVALVDQYLDFISEARALQLEVAGDYLVMASWLAFLKSRLLLPKAPEDEDATLTGEELARRLAFRLKRLEAMRNSAEQLMRQPRLGQDVFARGAAQPRKTIRQTVYQAEIYDLLKAYADQRKRTMPRRHVVRQRTVWSLKDGRERLSRVASDTWVQLDLFLSDAQAEPSQSRTALAATFGASLEMVRDGLLEMRQERPFAPLLLRKSQRQEQRP